MFWKRWKSEFLQVLQKCKKWQVVQKDSQTGDIVLLMEDDSPRNKWPIGIIAGVYPCVDGHVRKVKIKIARAEDSEPKYYVRPIKKIVALIEIECD